MQSALVFIFGCNFLEFIAVTIASNALNKDNNVAADVGTKTHGYLKMGIQETITNEFYQEQKLHEAHMKLKNIN